MNNEIVNQPQAIAAMEITHNIIGPMEAMMVRTSIVSVARIICATVEDAVNRKGLDAIKAALEVTSMLQGSNKHVEYFIDVFCALEKCVKDIKDGKNKELASNEAGVLIQKITSEVAGLNHRYRHMPIQDIYASLDDMFDRLKI